MNAILIGFEGRVDMYEFIGWVKRDEQAVASQPMTPDLFDSLF